MGRSEDVGIVPQLRRGTNKKICGALRVLGQRGLMSARMPARELLIPKRVDDSAVGELHVPEANYFVLAHITAEDAAFGQAERQGIDGASGGAVIDEPVGAEAADA